MNAPKPATLLPWRVSPIAPRSIQQESGIWSVAECTIDGDRNAPYIVAACNAYPQLVADRARLVEALRSALSAAKGDWQKGAAWDIAATALLRELGEQP